MLIRATKQGRSSAVWLRDDAPDHEVFFAASDLLVDMGCEPDDITEAFLEMLAKNTKET